MKNVWLQARKSIAKATSKLDARMQQQQQLPQQQPAHSQTLPTKPQISVQITDPSIARIGLRPTASSSLAPPLRHILPKNQTVIKTLIKTFTK